MTSSSLSCQSNIVWTNQSVLTGDRLLRNMIQGGKCRKILKEKCRNVSLVALVQLTACYIALKAFIFTCNGANISVGDREPADKAGGIWRIPARRSRWNMQVVNPGVSLQTEQSPHKQNQNDDKSSGKRKSERSNSRYNSQLT